MKKIILLFLCLFLLTGCTVNYDLNITKSDMTEDISISIPKSNLDKETKKFIKNNENIVYEGQDIFYKKNYKENKNNININYSYTHYEDNLANSKFLNWCYDKIKIDKTSETINISTSKTFKCLNHYGEVKIDKAIINIKTKLKVISNNADEVHGNTYTWRINKDNYMKSPINIQLENKYQILNKASKELFIIYGAIAVLIIILVLLIIFKLKRNNKI